MHVHTYIHTNRHTYNTETYRDDRKHYHVAWRGKICGRNVLGNCLGKNFPEWRMSGKVRWIVQGIQANFSGK